MMQISPEPASGQSPNVGMAKPVRVTVKLLIDGELVDTVETDQPSVAEARGFCRSVKETVEEMIAVRGLGPDDISG